MLLHGRRLPRYFGSRSGGIVRAKRHLAGRVVLCSGLSARKTARISAARTTNTGRCGHVVTCRAPHQPRRL